LLRNPIARAFLLAGVCLVAIAPFFWCGTPSGHDFEFHIDSWMEVLGQWKQGILYPRWAALAHWGYGEARFLFYPPASWTLGAALGAVLPWKLVPGAYCWIVLMLAGASMYRLARECLAPPAAMFAAVFYRQREGNDASTWVGSCHNQSRLAILGATCEPLWGRQFGDYRRSQDILGRDVGHAPDDICAGVYRALMRAPRHTAQIAAAGLDGQRPPIPASRAGNGNRAIRFALVVRCMGTRGRRAGAGDDFPVVGQYTPD